MSTASAATLQPVSTRKWLHIALWAAQVFLALVFTMAGGMKLIMSAKDLAANVPLPGGLVRFIGVSEVTGVLGLILPSVTRIKPKVTCLAALGLLTVMVLAALFHISRGEISSMLVTILLGCLAAFVAWGRYRQAPIAPR